METLIKELKRRNVFRVGAAYIVLGWLLIQVANLFESILTLPDWLDKIVLALLLLGFPFVIILSWAYEITPEGVKRTKEVVPEQSITENTAKRLNIITLCGLGLMALVLAYQTIFTKPVQQTSDTALDSASQTNDANSGTDESNASIAVLPFVNLSSDPEQDYFSDGISEELLNVLAKVPDLHVTSRSSAFAFKGKEINIPEVARKLGVDHVLEGSVRKSGTLVRITAQLIEADTDKHLWSETYDRSLDDIFAVQDEISAAIVEALLGKLGIKPDEQVRITQHKREQSPAYTKYLLAQHQLNKRTQEGITTAKKLFYEVIEADPTFAAPHADLAKVLILEGLGYGEASITREEALTLAKPLYERAIELAPDEAPGYAAKGLALRIGGELLDSIDVFKKALAINPSNSDARNWLSMSHRLLMQSKDEMDALIIGHAKDPLKESIATNLVKSYSRFQRFDEAAQVLERIKSLNLGTYGFSKSEYLMFQGRYADAIDAALIGAAAEEDFSLTLHVVTRLLAMMGEIDEAVQLNPYKGKSTINFEAFIRQETRDHEALLPWSEAYNQHQDAETVYTDPLLMWVYLAQNDFENAELYAEKILQEATGFERVISQGTIGKAVIAYRMEQPQKALELIKPLYDIVTRNMASGDVFPMNYVIAAMAKTFAGERQEALDLLHEGTMMKAPFSFEGEPFYALFNAMNWDTDPEYGRLLESYETFNQQQLSMVFAKACLPESQGGYAVWKPLPTSCAKYGYSGTNVTNKDVTVNK